MLSLEQLPDPINLCLAQYLHGVLELLLEEGLALSLHPAGVMRLIEGVLDRHYALNIELLLSALVHCDDAVLLALVPELLGVVA